MNADAFATVLAHEVLAGATEREAIAKAADVAGMTSLTLRDIERAKATRPDVFPPAITYKRLIR